jgi:sialidase-1
MSSPFPWSRRHFLAAAGASLIPLRARAAAPGISVQEIKTISLQPEYYCGWPTVARRADGSLVVTWSGQRESHVCPFGVVQMMTSTDEGATWTWPRTLLDSAIDDRDSGVLETAKGTLLVTTFTSLAYEPQLSKTTGWAPERLNAWQAAHARLSPEARKADLGQWLVRSTDGGLTWSTRLPTIVNSPHGPTQLRDGRLLYAGKELWTSEKRIGAAISEDDGLTWQWLAEIPTRSGDDAREYHELHAIETADGRIVAQIRNHNAANKGETLQSESADGGRTWSEPRSIGVWGLPSHLLRLRDDRLLITYGHRRQPFGNQARLSQDHGRTWSEPMIISDDGIGGDLGYPSTVELGDGSFLSVWYERRKESPKAVLRQARWKLG